MKTYRFIIGILIIVLTAAIIGAVIFVPKNKDKTVTSSLNNNINNIGKIDIVNGNTGNDISIEDEKLIGEFSDYLSKINPKKIHKEPSTGWTYRLYIYVNDKVKYDIIFNGEETCKINGVDYSINKSTHVSIESLFKKAEDSLSTESERSKDKIETKSNEQASNKVKEGLLNGIIICIDPGHQQKANLKTESIAPNSKEMKVKNTSGTSGVFTGTPEHVLTLDVSLRLKDELEKLGAKVIMTRETHKVDISNIERAEIANASNAQLTIRIHADGSEDRNVNGISVLIPGDKYIKDGKLLSKSKKAGKIILDALIKSTSAKSRGVIVRNDLTGFNWTKVPVILIEMGFVTNENEDRELNTDSYQREIVAGIINGVKEYFNKNG